MKQQSLITEDRVTIELIPTELIDKALIDGLDGVTTALVKRNGTLVFIMDLPKRPISKPIAARPADEVRDNMPGETK